MTENGLRFSQEMKVKLFDIESWAFIAVMHETDARELGVNPLERVEITCPRTKKSVVSVVDTTMSMVQEDEIGLFKDVRKALNASSTDTVIVSPSPQPESVRFIKKKLRGLELSVPEINAIVSDLNSNRLSEIEASAFMAGVFVHGYTLPEIVAMTKALADGGQRLELKCSPVVDKHSIGGINGRVTMVLVPIVAAAGLFIPKTASRSITSAAGTADSMEVLANVSLSVSELTQITEKIGGVVAWGGSVDLAPGDDKIIKIEHPLALDPEGQVIASVMAKKYSVGAKYLVIDIPIGPHMKINSREKAEQMARRFLAVGKKLGMKIKVVITDGSEPCGGAFGAGLEAKYALETLEGKRFDALAEKACELAGVLLELTGKASPKKGAAMAKNILQSGAAHKKMIEILKAQQGRIFRSQDVKMGKFKHVLTSPSDGEIASFDIHRLIGIARRAGAPGDPAAGVMLLVSRGENITTGKAVLEIYSDNERKLDLAVRFAKQRSGIELSQVILESF